MDLSALELNLLFLVKVAETSDGAAVGSMEELDMHRISRQLVAASKDLCEQALRWTCSTSTASCC